MIYPRKEARVVWRNDLKPIGAEQIELALSYKPDEIIVAISQLENAKKILSAFKTKAEVSAENGVAQCEILAAKWDRHHQSPPSVEDLLPGWKDRKIRPRKANIVIRIHEIRNLAKKGMNSKEIVQFFKKNRSVWMAKGQIDLVLEGKIKRDHVMGRIIEKKDTV